MDPAAIEYLEPWQALGEGGGFPFEAQLDREVGRGHPLRGRRMRAVARRQDCDEVLFVSTDEPRLIAVVHLTWSRRREKDPRWPDTTFYESWED